MSRRDSLLLLVRANRHPTLRAAGNDVGHYTKHV